MDADKEISAMQKIVDALSDLKAEQQGRVLLWAMNRFEMRASGPASAQLVAGGQLQSAPPAVGVLQPSYPDFATLFSAAEPKNGPERALVGGYWWQVCLGNETFEGLQVNNELKDIGHPLPNVTDSLSNLINRKPQLVLQVRKSGKAKQARKKYKLTHAGISYVKDMLQRS